MKIKQIVALSLISALGGAAILSAPTKAQDAPEVQNRDIPFQGLAQANCNFYDITTGYLVAVGNDLGTILPGLINAGSNGFAGTNQQGTIAGGTAGIPSSTGTGAGSAVSGSVTIDCNAQTAVFAYTPTLVEKPDAFAPVESRTVVSSTAGGTIMAFTNTDVEAGNTRTDGYILLDDASATGQTLQVDVNLRSLNTGVPVGSYKYTAKVVATPL